MDQRTETDAKAKMSRKSDHSSKFDKRYLYSEVFLLKTKLYASFNSPVVARKIRLEQKSMQPKFDVGGKIDKILKILKILKNDF